MIGDGEEDGLVTQVREKPASLCRYCDTEVFWADSGGRRMVPLSYIGETYVVVLGRTQVAKAASYVLHRCDPQRRQEVWDRSNRSAQEHQSATERKEAAQEAQAARHADYLAARDDVYRRAVKVDCDHCPAREAEECLNLNVLAGRKGSEKQKKYTSWPHQSRVLLAEKMGY